MERDTLRIDQAPGTRRRGFAILIVLAVLAMTSVILATQLASVKGQEITQIRAVEEIKARDVAEHCLALADAYAVAWANNNDDFDLLLDPNGTVEAAGDDFMPPSTLLSGTTNIVAIPPGGTGSRYRYRAFNVDVAGAGGTSGTCFIRYDDNSDDTNTLLTATATSNNTVVEGANVDVAERDRDRTIITTVVGVVPQRSDQATAYLTAHGRVTVRRVRAMPIGVNVGAGIESGGNVFLGGNSEVCGTVAGIVADTITGGSNTCICGVLNAQLISGTQGTTNGDCTCPTCPSSAGSTVTAGPRPDPVINIPPYTTLLKNESFGPVESTNNNIGAAAYPAAVIYVRNAAMAPAGYQAADTNDVFVWDKFDDDTFDTLATGGATQDCTDTAALDPLPSPCKWNLAAPAVTCAASESPCWKLVARLGDATLSADLDIRAGVGFVRPEQANVGSVSFTARAGDLPNVNTAAALEGEWQDFAAGSCATCGGAVTPVVPSGAGNVNFSVAANVLAGTPHLFIVIDSTATSRTTIGALTSNNGGVGAKITVSTNNLVTIAGSNHCCATCTCTQACAAGTTMTRLGNGPGYAVRTNKTCLDTAAFGIVGHVMCAQLDVGNSNGNCVVGGLIGLDSPGTLACTDVSPPPAIAAVEAMCDTSANFCAKNNFELVGNLQCAGNICLKNNLDMNGGIIETQSNIAWKNNPQAGQVRAAFDLYAGQNSTVTFNGTSGNVENQGVASAIWMDSIW